MRYKATINREAQIQKHSLIQSDATEQLTKDRKDEVAISTQYRACEQPFIGMLLQFKLIRDGDLGRIRMAKFHIELFQPDTAPVHSAPYEAGPKQRKFKKAEINKMLTENIMESAQTE